MKILMCRVCNKVYYTAYDCWNYANKELLERLSKEKVEVVEGKCPNCINPALLKEEKNGNNLYKYL